MDRIIDESELIETLKKSKNVLLIEPPYRRQYIPLGLAKIASFVKNNGGKIKYSRGSISNSNFDLICVATCFTNDFDIVIKSVRDIENSILFRKIPVIIGGICASLIPNDLVNETKRAKIFVNCSDILDGYLPDYSIDWQVKGFFQDCMTLFTTRGCPNKCGYCMVWRMEPKFHILNYWKENIEKINISNCVLSDNNFLAANPEHIESVINCLNENNKKVIFNNGVDCKLINDDNAKLLASLAYTRNGFRTAFDRMTDDGHYQKAMEKLIKAGLRISGNSYTYVLFNFNDTPQEAYYRATECWKYKSNPYLMRYRPLDQKQKQLNHIGKYWTKNLIRAFSYYGQTFGYNRGDKTFEGWIKSSEIKLTSEDWDKWNYRR